MPGAVGMRAMGSAREFQITAGQLARRQVYV